MSERRSFHDMSVWASIEDIGRVYLQRVPDALEVPIWWTVLVLAYLVTAPVWVPWLLITIVRCWVGEARDPSDAGPRAIGYLEATAKECERQASIKDSVTAARLHAKAELYRWRATGKGRHLVAAYKHSPKDIARYVRFWRRRWLAPWRLVYKRASGDKLIREQFTSLAELKRVADQSRWSKDDE